MAFLNIFFFFAINTLLLFITKVNSQSTDYQNQCPLLKSFSNTCHSGKIKGIIFESKNQLLFSYGDNAELFLWNLSKNQYSSRLTKDQNKQIIAIQINRSEEYSLTYLNDEGELLKINYLSMEETKYNTENLKYKDNLKGLDEISNFHPCLNVLYFKNSQNEIVVFDYENNIVLETISFQKDNSIDGIIMSHNCNTKEPLIDYVWTKQGNLIVITYKYDMKSLQIIKTQIVIENLIKQTTSQFISDTQKLIYISYKQTIESVQIIFDQQISIVKKSQKLRQDFFKYLIIENRQECLLWSSPYIVDILSLKTFEIVKSIQLLQFNIYILKMITIQDQFLFTILDNKNTIYLFQIPDLQKSWQDIHFKPIKSVALSSNSIFQIESRDQFVIAYTETKLEKEYLIIYNIHNSTIFELSCNKNNYDNTKIAISNVVQEYQFNFKRFEWILTYYKIDKIYSRGLLLDYQMNHYIMYQNSQINIWDFMSNKLLKSYEIEEDNYFSQVVLLPIKGYIVYITNNQQLVIWDYFNMIKIYEFQFLSTIHEIIFFQGQDNYLFLFCYSHHIVFKFQMLLNQDQTEIDQHITQDSIKLFEDINIMISQCLQFKDSEQLYYICSLTDTTNTSNQLVLIHLQLLVIELKFNISLAPDKICIQQNEIFIFNKNGESAIIDLKIQPYEMNILQQSSSIIACSNIDKISLAYDPESANYLVLADEKMIIFSRKLIILQRNELKKDSQVQIQSSFSSFQRAIQILQSYYVVYNRISIFVLDRTNFLITSYLEFEDISYIKCLHISEKRILFSTGDQSLLIYSTPNLIQQANKMLIAAEEIILNEETNHYIYLDQYGQSHVIYFNDYLIKTELQEHKQIVQFYYDGKTENILVSSQKSDTTKNWNKIKVFSKQLQEQEDDYFEFDLNSSSIAGYSPLGYDKFLILNDDKNSTLISTYKWQNYNIKNSSLYLHSLVSFNYKTKQLLSIELSPHISPIIFLLQGNTNQIITSSGNNIIKVWRADTLKLEKYIPKQNSVINDIIFDEQENILIVCLQKQQLIFYDFETLQIITQYSKFKNSCERVAISLFRQNLIATEKGGTIIVFNYKTRLPIQYLDVQATSFNLMLFYPFYNKEDYLKYLNNNSTSPEIKQKEENKRIITTSIQGKLFVYGWKQINLQNADLTQQYLKEIQQGITVKSELSLMYSLDLQAEIQVIEINQNLDLLIVCTNGVLMIAKYSDGTIIQRIDLLINSSEYMNSKICKKIIIITEYMQLYIHTNEKIIVYNLAYIINGPYLYQLESNFQQNLIKPFNTQLSVYLSRSQESQLQIIDQNAHLIFTIFQGFNQCKIQNFFNFFDNVVLIICFQSKILLFNYNIQSYNLEILPISLSIQEQIQKCYYIKQSQYYHQLFYLLKSPSEIIALKFYKENSSIQIDLTSLAIQKKRYINDVMVVSRLQTLIIYIDGGFSICNPQITLCIPVMNDFSSQIQGFQINPMNNSLLFIYSNIGDIILYEINYNKQWFLQNDQQFDDVKVCQGIDNIDFPNLTSHNNYSDIYKNELLKFINDEFKKLYPNTNRQPDELDFIKDNMIFSINLVKKKQELNSKISGFYIFQDINKFITLCSSKGLIYLWDLQQFEILKQIQIPQLQSNLYIMGCNLLNTFILSSKNIISQYSYIANLSTFKLTNCYIATDDQIANPSYEILNYFQDYQILQGENSYKIININQKKESQRDGLIQKISIAQPNIISVQMKINPQDKTTNLIIFGFSINDIFQHTINLQQKKTCVLQLNKFNLNELNDELKFIERNQEVSNYKISNFTVILTSTDPFSIIENIPNFQFSNSSSLIIIGEKSLQKQPNSQPSLILIKQNWQQLSLFDIDFGQPQNQYLQLQFVGSKTNKFNELYLQNVIFSEFKDNIFLEVDNYKIIDIENIQISSSSFTNQTLIMIKNCDSISLSSIHLELISTQNFHFLYIQGSFTSNYFQSFSLQNCTINNSSLINSNLYFLQFGNIAQISQISMKNIIGQNSRIFQMQGILSSQFEFMNFTENTGIQFLNSTRIVTINYQIYSQFNVYSSSIQLKKAQFNESLIDKSIGNILSFHEQEVNLSQITFYQIVGESGYLPQLILPPFYNPQENIGAQNGSNRILGQNDDSEILSVIKVIDILKMNIDNLIVIKVEKTNHIIQSIGEQHITLEQSLFQFNGSEELTLGLIYLEKSTIQLNFVIFENNKSNKCTTLLQNSQSYQEKIQPFTYIINSVFYDNSAKEFGGGLCYTSPFLKIENTRFEENSAQFGGAFFYSLNTESQEKQTQIVYRIANQLKNVTFINNKSNLFGTNYVSGISYMKVLNLPFDGSSYILKNFRSGDSLSGLKIQIYDEEHNVIQNDQNQSLNFKLRPIRWENINVINQSDFEYSLDANNTISVLTNDKMSLFGNVGEDGFLYFSSDFIDQRIDSSVLKPDEQVILKLRIVFRDCISGEIQRLEIDDKETGDQYFSCFQCPAGKYSLINPVYEQNSSKMCQLCPTDKATFCEKDVIQIKSGYWRENNQTDLILYCINNPDACLGQDQCQEGHIGQKRLNLKLELYYFFFLKKGPLCEDCDIQGYSNGKKYTRINNEVFSCIECDNNFAQIFIMFLLQVAITGYLVWSIKEGLNRSKQIVMADLMRKLTLVSLGKSSQSNTSSAFIKIIAHYIQIISSLKYYHRQYPSFGLLYVDYIGDPIDKATFAFDCILINFSYLHIPFQYVLIIWSQLYQIIYLLIYLAVYYCLIKMKRVEYRQYAISNAIIFFVLFIQNSIVSQLISVLICRKIGNKSYIRFSISHECYTDEYYSYSFRIVLPLLILWAFAIPAIGFYLMWRIRKKLFTFFNTLNYGLIYLEYKPKYFYWEFVKMIKKILILFLVNYFYQNIYYQGIFSLIIILCYTKLLKKVAPYKQQYFNQLELKSSLIQIIFYFLVLIQASTINSTIALCLSWLVVIINLVFLIYMIYLCISSQTTIQQLYAILHKIPCLRRCVEKKIPVQPRIFSSHQLWRSLSIYVRDFVNRKKLDKNAKFYVEHLKIGSSQDSYRISQLKTSQQLKNLQRSSSQNSIFFTENMNTENKADQNQLSKLQLNEIVTESKVITRFDVISEENQEEDHEVQSEKNPDNIPQQSNQIIIPDFCPNQTKLQIEGMLKQMRSEIIETQGDYKIMQTQSFIFQDVKQITDQNHSQIPSVISPQSFINQSSSNYNLFRKKSPRFANFNLGEEEVGFDYEQQHQQPEIPRFFQTKMNNLNAQEEQNYPQYQEFQLTQINQTEGNEDEEQQKVINSLITPRNEKVQTKQNVQTARVNFIEKMKRTITFRSAKKQ